MTQEELFDKVFNCIHGCIDGTFLHCNIKVISKWCYISDILQQDIIETKEVDLEKEMDKEWNNCEPIDEGMGLEIASIEHEQFDNIAKHFFELGLKTKGE